MAQPAYAPHHTTHPMVEPARPFIADDLFELPEGYRGEIVDGVLHVTPPADLDHHGIADEIRGVLRSGAPEGWRVLREVGIRIKESTVIPDITVLRPGAPRGGMWADPADVVLVVEVESPSSRRHDRFLKPTLYAEAGIESYWRIERTEAGPVAHLYTRASGEHYALHRSVNPGENVLAELPYPVQVAPAAWPH